MTVLLVVNPAAGGADRAVVNQVAEVLVPLGDVELLEAPRDAGAFATEMARRMSDGRTSHLVVAGGDGTLNCTINALGHPAPGIVLGLVPMGTGNDLARTLGLPDDPEDAARVAVGDRTIDLDVCRASGGGVERLFVNACMGGIAVQVNEAIDDKTKERYGPLAFWIGGAKVLSDLQRFTVVLNGVEVQDCLAAGVGNGRTCGGGLEVWPAAHPDDGVLEACALPAGSGPAALKLAVKVKTGTHDEVPEVATVSAEKIELDARPGIELNVDGELVGLKTPATFEPVGKIKIAVP
ncbi:MAG: hypothetical protein M3345_08150 [Actinomycetota bacterium]|nr:hypothetical protein [Actinomycetota bacterium]